MNRYLDSNDTESTGAKVYITGRRMDALENAARKHSPESDESSGSIIPIGPCDVTSKKSIEDLVSHVEAKEKYLSLFVAAAGTSGPKGFPDTSDAEENPLAGVRRGLEHDI